MSAVKTISAALVAGLVLTGCGGGGGGSTELLPEVVDPPPPPVMQSYEVSVVNLTAGQPFSPVTLVVHDTGYSTFEVGGMATDGLEMLAEGGDNSAFLSEAQASEVFIQSWSAEGPLPPGATEVAMVSLTEDEAASAYVSVITMLVNTNDAITGVRGVHLSALEVGQSVTMTTIGYDAGTEANSELPGTIPGPADGGEGFNAERDDLDIVTGHAGVLTQDDGLATSVLTETHRWDNPIGRVTIARVE